MNTIYLREATKEDVDLLFHWANDEQTRKNAFHTEQIPYEDHVAWFQRVLSDDSVKQFIMMVQDIPVGQIRLNIEEDRTAEIDYSIGKDFRGQGYGKLICKLLIEKIKEEDTKITSLIAKVKPDNVPSAACFLRSGFEEKYIHFEYKLKEE